MVTNGSDVNSSPSGVISGHVSTCYNIGERASDCDDYTSALDFLLRQRDLPLYAAFNPRMTSCRRRRFREFGCNPRRVAASSRSAFVVVEGALKANGATVSVVARRVEGV